MDNRRLSASEFLEFFKSLLGSAPKEPTPRLYNREKRGVVTPKRRYSPTETGLANVRQRFTGVTSPSSTVKASNKRNINFGRAVFDGQYQVDLMRHLDSLPLETRSKILDKLNDAVSDIAGP